MPPTKTIVPLLRFACKENKLLFSHKQFKVLVLAFRVWGPRNPNNLEHSACCWASQNLVASRALDMECGRTHARQAVWMAYTNQTSHLQGFHSVSCDILTVDDLGIGSGWQQSKQNHVLLAVVRQRNNRTECSNHLCCRAHMAVAFLAIDQPTK